MKRYPWLYNALIVVVLLLAWGIFEWNTTHFGLGYWLQVHTGTVNEPGPYYGFFSGFGSDITEITLLGGIIVIGRRFNCHTTRCWRIGRHHVAGGQYLICGRHFRAVTCAPKKVTVEHLQEVHKAHIETLGCHHETPEPPADSV